MDQQTLNVLAQIALVALVPLLGIIGWFVQNSIKDNKESRDQMEKNFTQSLARSEQSFTQALNARSTFAHETIERLERETQARFAQEAGARALAIAEAERTHQELQEKFNSLQREVDKDYINFERLEQIVRPLRESVDAVRKEVTAVFDKLDNKQDKHSRHTD